MTVNSPTDQILVEVTERVGWVVLNTPERRNALTPDMMRAIPQVLDDLINSAGARVVVFRGAGGRAFCAGADLSAVADTPEPADAPSLDTHYEAMLARVRKLPVPSIAMIEGACLGGGLALALATDLRYSTPDALVGIPAARLGMAYVDVDPLVAAVGYPRAAELLLTARNWSGDQAYAAGLVNAVAAPEELLTTVQEVAGSIARNAPLAIAATKRALGESRKCAGDRDSETLAALAAQCRQSEDFAEGRRAFLDKRSPQFQGR
ncbi:enoyl-CoA hydratase-related protein [Rhodococcus sp. JS3073]|uniref:enoyl-CoA hydratase-related protein n=1 Tax=Rhodococcus sp. JS3073 TaxID=3002901 RepID=UPI00228677C7|nr:enoyl-CoA hydratase-related protein [Rhodococcus sp. JS3073]WAM19638.1 enoyl-CoA hydratase-related protein [Rhodococcus sp. JS3073]